MSSKACFQVQPPAVGATCCSRACCRTRITIRRPHAARPRLARRIRSQHHRVAIVVHFALAVQRFVQVHAADRARAVPVLEPVLQASLVEEVAAGRLPDAFLVNEGLVLEVLLADAALFGRPPLLIRKSLR